MSKNATAQTQTPEELMERLLNGTSTSVDTLKSTNETDFGIGSLLGNAEKMLQQIPKNASDIKSDSAKALADAHALMMADYKSVRDNTQLSEVGIRQAMLGLATIAGSIDVQIKGLKDPTPEEAAERVAQVEAIDSAKLEVKIAEQKNFLVRGSAVRAATAELRVEEDKLVALDKRVASAIENRLQNSTLAQSLTQFTALAARIAQVMGEGAAKMAAQIQLVTASQVRAAEAKTQISGILVKLDAELTSKEADLARERETLSAQVNGTPEYATQQAVINRLESVLAELRGKHNLAQGVFQEKELEVEEMKVIEETLTSLKFLFATRKAMAESNCQKRATMWRAALDVMRAGQTSEAANDVDKVGRKIDHDLVMLAASTNIAAQRAMNETLTGIPVHLNATFTVSEAHNHQMAKFTAEIADLYGQMKQNYPKMERLSFVDEPKKDEANPVNYDPFAEFK